MYFSMGNWSGCAGCSGEAESFVTEAAKLVASALTSSSREFDGPIWNDASLATGVPSPFETALRASLGGRRLCRTVSSNELSVARLRVKKFKYFSTKDGIFLTIVRIQISSPYDISYCFRTACIMPSLRQRPRGAGRRATPL